MTTRAWPIPPKDRTIHLIGDTHIGQYGAGPIAQENTRRDKWSADLSNPLLITPKLRDKLRDKWRYNISTKASSSDISTTFIIGLIHGSHFQVVTLLNGEI